MCRVAEFSLCGPYLTRVVQELVERDGCGYAHPFDDPLLWVGHGSLVKELRTQLGDAKPGCVVVPSIERF